jgi:hypothetical protein
MPAELAASAHHQPAPLAKERVIASDDFRFPQPLVTMTLQIPAEQSAAGGNILVRIRPPAAFLLNS